MRRPTSGSSSAFGQLIRRGRENLRLSRAELARRLGWSHSFLDVLETGRRGCNLEDLSRIADTLQVDRHGFAQVYLSERHPGLYAALFGNERPEIVAKNPGAPVEDVHWRLDQLPRRERGIVEALIYALYELTTGEKPQVSQPQAFFIRRDQVNLDFPETGKGT